MLCIWPFLYVFCFLRMGRLWILKDNLAGRALLCSWLDIEISALDMFVWFRNVIISISCRLCIDEANILQAGRGGKAYAISFFHNSFLTLFSKLLVVIFLLDKKIVLTCLEGSFYYGNFKSTIGEMRVQTRWFNVLGFCESVNPCRSHHEGISGGVHATNAYHFF